MSTGVILQFYSTSAWRRVRKQIMQRSGGLCEDCLKAGLYSAAVEVHHIKPLTPDNVTDPMIATNPDNLVALCEACHDRRHQGAKRFVFLPDGTIGPP